LPSDGAPVLDTGGIFDLVCAISENMIVEIMITTIVGKIVDFFIAGVLEVYSYVNKLI